ncbi:MAG TPA: lipid droplet-associated protein [Pseudonocardiaceae bacterium]|nr:lipid droplet-associated protein [Pseudonocardiaceae bacterium]
MSTLPWPVRIAVGLAATAVEQAHKLPELPVTAASRAVQAAMRVQQRVTELAIKGDEVFAMFQPVEEAPPWARFDEDDDPGARGTRNGTTGAAREFGQVPGGAAPTAAAPRPGTGHGTPAGASGEIDEADVARAMTPAPSEVADAQPRNAAPAEPADASVARSAIDPPPVLPHYDDMSIAQLRAKLRTLSLPELTELLEYEHAHQDRAAFVTMLSNRISTVRSR